MAGTWVIWLPWGLMLIFVIYLIISLLWPGKVPEIIPPSSDEEKEDDDIEPSKFSILPPATPTGECPKDYQSVSCDSSELQSSYASIGHKECQNGKPIGKCLIDKCLEGYELENGGCVHHGIFY